ncbi:vigilin isoform X3 [Carcharodon carcharias]|uniref:vigilin isoform X3 n=1 Tax=Carcharodon carcharias TaxID=13397 RepID=UPI001B7E31DF|nr:vigilin isoform X3 [Carcharodon carcharias]
MSSVAVLTPESFAEHRSGLGDQETRGGVPEDEAYIPTYLEAFPPLPEKGAPGDKSGEPIGAWSKIRPIKSSVITQVFHVPLEERRYKDNSQFGEGEEAKVCLDIMQKTGAHIELSLAKDQGLSIMVTGKLDSVMKARKEIVARLQTQASATVTIPKEHHRFVIGKNGEKLQELELKTATKINIPRPDDSSNQIKITGTKEGIEKSRHEILLISAEQDKRAVERINLEKVFHPFIAGAYNKVVQEIMQETGARINIPPPSINKDEIFITGEKEPVAQAGTRIRKIYEEKKRKTTTISVEVKKSQHKYIIGPKGNTLQEILDMTGVSVEMPSLESSSETIILRGEPDKLGPALTQVYAKAKSVMVAEVTAPAWLHRFIIGKKGQNIGRITQQLPKVHIEFTDGDEKITLEGPTEEVEIAQTQIQDIINDLLTRMDYTEITVEQKFHRHLIGKNGANINRIKEQYKVSVRIPPDNEKSHLIRIEGEPQGVQLAKKELLEMAVRMENERTKDLIIEQRLHRSIIGQKGEKIKEVRDKFPEVIINFPDPAQKSDIVQLRGPKNEVEKCGKFLQKVIADLIENSYSVSIPIFKQFHKNIIGKGGANIKKIREETNTKIDLPTENSNSEVILITGKKANCEAARDRILSIQRELANIKEVDVLIPAKLHNSLIGAKGRLVRSLMEDCGGVHIHFPSEGSGSDKVTIRGPVEEVEKARKQLLQLAEEKDNVIEDLMIVDPKYHRHFVARRGQVLREIAEEYGGVTVSFPRTGVQSDRVMLKGAKDCVEAAKRRIQEIIGDLEAQVTLECVIPQRFHRAVMGLKGSKVQQITRDYDVQIKFPERDENQAGLDLHPQENGDLNSDLREVEHAPRKCDIIVISGRKEKCEAAREALLALVPVTVDVEVPFDLHRYIIGQKGSGIRKMMEEYEVNIAVPPPEQQSDIIKITGLTANLERARAGILERVRELQAEQEDRALRGFKLTMSVDPKYHPKIIGRKGAVISQIRKDHDVNIQFPDKGDENQDMITITGYERNAESAKDAIMKIVADLEEMVSEDINLDHRVHARIIGGRGKAIRKIMEEFKVDIRFPPPGSDDPNRVTVTGLPEHVDNAIDHLLNLEEEYMMAIVESETMAAYMKPPSRVEEEPRGSARGFVVRDAPWNAPGNKAPDVSSAEEFPMFGTVVAPRQASAWGPKKF